MTVASFEIDPEQIAKVKEAAMVAGLPLLEEYDFRRDTTSPKLHMDLRGSTKVRPYQEKCLAKMFGNGRARSGIIVLPCGAGKTLVGISTCATIQKSCICVVSGSVAARQWKRSFQMFTNIKDRDIVMLSSKDKQMFPIDRIDPVSGHCDGVDYDPETGKRSPRGVLCITTYSMLTTSGKRAADTTKIMERIGSTDWGLMVLDEVRGSRGGCVYRWICRWW